jgi:hypothetical protein
LTASNAIVGGTVSVIGGGKFANGAVTGAFTMLFNDILHNDNVENKRENLARSAEREWRNHSTQWKTVGLVSKCNIFAQDMMVENDMAPYDNALSAGDWGDPHKEISGWEVVKGEPQRGDIGAYKANYSNATGHMGIMVDSKNIIYAGSSVMPQIGRASRLDETWVNRNWVFRRYIGK